MPEGHTVHRTANQFNEYFGGRLLRVDSPQGRFSAAARLVDQQVLRTAVAVGKQLFLHFENDLTVRIHLGIYGKWRWYSEFTPSGAVEQVRARFFLEHPAPSQVFLADLRGPTVCDVIDQHEVEAVLARLGPDPLNADYQGAELDRFVRRVTQSKTAIGQLLMDQSVIAGVGNVYRAELLFRAGLNPFVPGSKLAATQVQKIWEDAVVLMEIGVKTGVMITREELFDADPPKLERHFVYKREGQRCRVCGADIALELMQARKLYWCPGCQA